MASKKGPAAPYLCRIGSPTEGSVPNHNIDPNGETMETSLYVVAVHGLNGNSRSTWAGWTKGKTWLEEIGAEIPRIRLFTFCYESDITVAGADLVSPSEIWRTAAQLLYAIDCEFGKEINTSDQANSPKKIAFVAHGFGGIIVKQALNLASYHHAYMTLASLSVGVLFFGSPQEVWPDYGYGSWEKFVFHMVTVTPGNTAIYERLICLFERMPVDEAYMAHVCANFASIVGKRRIINIFPSSYLPARPEIPSPHRSFTRIATSREARNSWRIARNQYRQALRRVTTWAGIDNYNWISRESVEDDLGLSSFPTSNDNVLSQISNELRSMAEEPYTYDLAGITFRKKLAALCPVINLPFVESHRGTSGWLLEEKTYQDWVKGNERPILYLSGSNGMGKTSTSHFLVETLRSENIVLSFFCTRQAHRRESAKHILLSMVSQFLLHEPHLYSLAQNLLSLKQTSVWTQEDMWAVFRALISQPRSKELVCVVDNLDECGSDRWLMENFLWLYDELDIPFKLIITGKPYCLNKALTSPKHQKKLVELHLEGGSDDKKMRKEIVDDMETSTRNWISDLVRKSPVYRGLEATILEQYRAHFFGKFGASPLALKVSFGLLNPPRAGFSVASLREQLHCLGEDIQLSVLYKNLLEQIPRYDRPWAMNVLRWICYTFRPLTIMELSAAMSIDARSTADKVVKKQLSSKNFSWNIRDDIYRIFGQLVEFKRDQIHLVHHSLHDFLINGAEKHDWYYLEDSAIIHGRIFDVCLTLLIAEKTSGHLNFQSGGYLHQAQLCLASSSDQNDNNFLLYASQYWPRHYQESAKLLPSVNKILDFLNADQIASLWFKVYGYLVGDEEDQYSPLLVAAKLGLPMIADRLIAVAPSSDPGNREAALAVAATYGHECVVEELLFTGARLSEALYRASKMGHVRVVSRLLEAAKNDKVDLAGLNINAGLCAAAANGHSKVVKKLLKSGASVRCPDSKDGLTPLQHAVKNGRGHVVRVLLHPPKARQCRSAKVQDDHDDHDDYDDDNKTLLIERSRHIEFRNSADTNKEQRARILGTKDDTTAEIATPNPDDDTIDQGKVEKVVEGGDSEPETEDEESDDSDDDDMDQKDEGREKEDININFKDSEDVKKRSVFHLAAEGGYLEIINKLPDEYAVNIMAAAGQSTTPLHLAAAGGYLKVVKMLSKRFESWVPYKDEKGCLALHHAVQGGHSLVVDYLLKRDITAAVSTPVDGRQALHIAAKYGHKDIVNSLLTQKELEIAVDATDRDGYTPLQIAVQEGHHDVALSLLTAGADIDKGGPGPITRAPISLFSRFGRYRPKKNKPPLHLAAECGHLELIKLLLDKGASINKTDTQSGWTALHCANRQPACVQMLIDRGAYLEAQNIDGSTPLILAAQEGTTEGVRALLKAGANPTAVNKRTHISALHKAAGSGDWESIKLLLDCGVNPFALAQGSNSGTSFDFALNCRRQDVDGRNLARMMIDWLIPENFWPDPFKLAVASGSHRLLDVWIEYRPDDLEKYDYKDLMTEKGTPLLHLLAASGMHSVIRKIVKVDPESLSRQDSKGRVLQDIVMDSDTQKLLQTLTEQTSNAGNHQTVSAEDNVAVSSDKSTPDSPQSHEADTEYECPKCRKPQPEMVLCWSCKRVMDGEFLNHCCGCCDFQCLNCASKHGNRCEHNSKACYIFDKLRSMEKISSWVRERILPHQSNVE